MTTYIKVEVIRREVAVALSRDEVMTLVQAAQLRGVRVQSVANRLDRGLLTTIINPRAPSRQGRRLVLRSEVEEWANKG